MDDENPEIRHDWDEVSSRYLRDARRKTAEDRWRNSCPPALQESDWNCAELAPFRAAIDRVLCYRYGKKGLLLSGPTGTGKSRAAWQLIYRLGVIDGLETRSMAAAEFFYKLNDQVNYGHDDACAWVKRLAGIPVLFLDDLGQEAVIKSKEEWAKSWFFQLLDMRLGLGLPLFVTTNLSAAELAEYGGGVRGDPLVRRLLELCDPVVFNGRQG